MILMFSAALVSAENKQQVRLVNNYGNKITVDFIWKNKSFPYDLKVEQKEFETDVNNSLIKAPVSGYRLFQMLTTPSKNLNLNKNDAISLAGSGIAVSGAVTGNAVVAYAGLGVAYAGLIVKMLESKNHFVLKKVNKNLFFAIEKGSKNSDIKGQKKIVIKGYQSEEDYQNVLEENIQLNSDENLSDDLSEPSDSATESEILEEVKELLDDLSEGVVVTV